MNTIRKLKSQPVLLAAALGVASWGWRVFPVEPGGKRPAVRIWQQRATCDEARIRRCWGAGPFNIGVACEPSRLVVIDLDTPKIRPGEIRRCGVDVLRGVADQKEAPPGWEHTLTVATPSGGRHLYYTLPGGMPSGTIPSTVQRLGPLVDTRARGGYVLAAGSCLHGENSTQDYAVVDDLPVRQLPFWLAALLTDPGDEPVPVHRRDVSSFCFSQDRRGRYAAAALRNEYDAVTGAPEGTRNHTLNRAAYNLGQLTAAHLIDKQTVVETLTAAAHTAGLGERETAATIASGLKAGAANPRKVAT